jgi:hypothetical protein
MIFAVIEPPQYVVVPPTSGKRIDRHDQSIDYFAVGGFGRWSIGLRTSTKPIFQRNSCKLCNNSELEDSEWNIYEKA